VTFTPGYRPLEWTDDLAGRYWRWQAHFPEQYFTRQFGDRIAARLQKLLRGRRSVLDYGSGVGYLVAPLAKLGHDVTAADHSEAAVAATNERNAGVANFTGASTPQALIAAGRRFDAIVSIEVIEHLSDGDLHDFFASFTKLLAPDGIAVITTPNEEDLRAAETYCPCCEHVFHRWQHLRSWSATSLAAAVEVNGLAVVETFATDFVRRKFDLYGDAKKFVKRLIGRAPKQPNLVCVVRLKNPGPV
jgi:2-polyprenyl-3-methyl-5-hydroxy-6-metoxy-1,4-benzoquinol methylase